MLSILAIGFVMGFAGSMPVAGPLAILIFTRAIEGRFRAGMMLALGGALAESAYAFIAFAGLGALLRAWPPVVPITRVIAAVILIALGVLFIRQRPVRKDDRPPQAERSEARGLANLVLGFAVVALNPTLVATWTGAAGTVLSLGLVDADPSMSILFAVGACVGILTWFTLLLFLIHRFRGSFSEQTLHGIIRVMGGFLILVGLWFAWMFVQGLAAPDAAGDPGAGTGSVPADLEPEPHAGPGTAPDRP